MSKHATLKATSKSCPEKPPQLSVLKEERNASQEE